MSLQEQLTTIAENVPKVYEAGIAEGKKQMLDTVWEVFQHGGIRNIYTRGFDTNNFDASTFYPKYDIVPQGDATRIFYNWSLGEKFSLAQRLRDCGVTLDLSQCVLLQTAFSYGTCFTEIPTIDLTGITNGTTAYRTEQLFRSCVNLVTVEKLIIKEDIAFYDWFAYCQALRDITIEGTIGQNGFDIHWSNNLTKASLTSIMEHLSTTVSNKSIILPLAAIDREFETSPGANDGSDSGEWASYILSNWSYHYA